MKIVIDIPDETPVRKVNEFAQSLGGNLYRLDDGTYKIRPRGARPKVVPLPRAQSRQPQPAA